MPSSPHHSPHTGSSRPAQRSDDDPDQLLLQVSGGDPVAFEQLYRTFTARVFGLALRVLRSASHASGSVNPNRQTTGSSSC